MTRRDASGRDPSGRDAIERALRAIRPPDPTPDEVGEATERVLASFAARLDTVEDALRDVRPANPVEDEAREAAARVLARVGLLASGAGAETAPGSPRTLSTVARIAAAIVVAVVLTQVVGHRPLRDGTAVPPLTEPELVCDALTTCVEDAIRGDILARQRVLTAGPRARTVLLTRAEEAEDGAVEALGLLRAMGGIRLEGEAERLRELARRDATREPAIALLAAAPTAAGARQLGILLAEEPRGAEKVVEHLLAVATRGRRTAALGALLDGAAAGRVEAAVAAFAVARATALERLLASLPDVLLEDARVAAAVQGAPVTTRDRLLRRAVAGDPRALRLAVAADLDGVLPVLSAVAQAGGEAEARWAVGALARRSDLRAWMALVDARDGPAGDDVETFLLVMPDEIVDDLEQRARRDPARRRSWLAALGTSGRRGALALERLAAVPALRAPAIDTLAEVEGPAASHALSGLAAAGGESDRVLVALARRVQRGDGVAASALLTLARGGSSRRAIRLLERHASGAGRTWIAKALADDTLPAALRSALERATRTERTSPRPEGIRAVRRPSARTAPSPIT